jgi:hypothetical protein
MSDWLYQYWFFSFKTAKHWGKGPTSWTAELLNFDRFSSHNQRSLPGTPRERVRNDSENTEPPLTPTDLCRWFIHVRADWPYYDEIPGEENVQHSRDQNPDDEATWRPWLEDQQLPQLATRLRNALEHNDFSPTPTSSLPVAIPVIARAAERAPKELLLEALGFSIMSRNQDQVQDTITKMREHNIDYLSLYPLHMAADYLDGSKTCCDIVSSIVWHLAGQALQQLRETFINELGHTVWDHLMISILKSHSSARPSIVNEAWKDSDRFPGEEVDICGRWDADSPAVRRLLSSGRSSTPFAWKHKFCHTSTQAICHYITMVFNILPSSLFYETPSGLYTRRCFHCGVKLQLHALHCLVITAYHLANGSCQDEDLFGILACLLCFVACGLDLRKRAIISVTALMEADTLEDECEHRELTAADLAEKIALHPNTRDWNETIQSGWAVICGVLRLCEDADTRAVAEESDSLMRVEPTSNRGCDPWYEREGEKNDENMEIDSRPAEVCDGQMDIGTRTRYSCSIHDEPGDEYEAGPLCFRVQPDLASLWAATQAELLIHRRLKESKRWTSVNFSMETLRDQLANSMPLSVGYHDKALLKPHCPCGRFECGPLAVLSDVIDPDIDTDPNPDTKLIKVDCKDAWPRSTYGAFFLEEHQY